MPTKWRSLVVSEAKRIPAGGPKWSIVPAEMDELGTSYQERTPLPCS